MTLQYADRVNDVDAGGEQLASRRCRSSSAQQRTDYPLAREATSDALDLAVRRGEGVGVLPLRLSRLDAHRARPLNLPVSEGGRMPDRRTLEGVEIARVGTFRCRPASTRSPASSSPPPSRTPRSTRRASGSATRTRASTCRTTDGDPAFGKVVNLRLAEDGDLLLGDLAEMPAWLADNAPAAYPGRSLEGPPRATTSRSARSSCSAPRSPASRRSPICRRRSPRPSRPARPPRAGHDRRPHAVGERRHEPRRPARGVLRRAPHRPSNDGDWWCVRRSRSTRTS
jgi:hypothetical protein